MTGTITNARGEIIPCIRTGIRSLKIGPQLILMVFIVVLPDGVTLEVNNFTEVQ